jgi:diaminopimelate epimerase
VNVRIPLTKMHGTRNDFVILDARGGAPTDLAGFARWACDRHTGVGADGLIVIETSPATGFRMRTINADGGEAEMCGNGVRCAARWLDEAGAGSELRFDTMAGVVETRVIAREPEYLVRVAIGTPRVSALAAPFLDSARFVNLGNPHVVLFRKHVDEVDLTMLATRLQTLPLFHGGTNVHIAALEDGEMRVRHWERGVGLTMACGTGAVACAAAAIDQGMLESPVDVFVPGGHLLVEWSGSGVAYLTGPAVRVFDTDVRFEAGVAD